MDDEYCIMVTGIMIYSTPHQPVQNTYEFQYMTDNREIIQDSSKLFHTSYGLYYSIWNVFQMPIINDDS